MTSRTASATTDRGECSSSRCTSTFSSTELTDGSERRVSVTVADCPQAAQVEAQATANSVMAEAPRLAVLAPWVVARPAASRTAGRWAMVAPRDD